jgi:hypothetical protein
MKINVERKRSKGRPKNKWLGTIENDMRAKGVCIGDVECHDE